MRTTRTLPLGLTRRAAVVASLALAGTLCAVPGIAQAAASPTAPAASSGHGLKWSQERHGLPRTGSVDGATARALRQAPDAELRRTFRTAADLGPEELANARTVIGVGKGAQIPEQGLVIALMTAMQESTFVNYLTPVDHDSLGDLPAAPERANGPADSLTRTPSRRFPPRNPHDPSRPSRQEAVCARDSSPQ
ncbi:peptidoglycan-binding protein [Streptomyces sp. NPDC055099]